MGGTGGRYSQGLLSQRVTIAPTAPSTTGLNTPLCIKTPGPQFHLLRVLRVASMISSSISTVWWFFLQFAVFGTAFAQRRVSSVQESYRPWIRRCPCAERGSSLKVLWQEGGPARELTENHHSSSSLSCNCVHQSLGGHRSTRIKAQGGAK